MENKEMIEKLTDLVKLDIDAVHAYGQAIKHIDISDVREQVVKFQGDHERHVTNLSEAIRLLGGQPPEFSRDFKGYLLEGFTALRSMTGTEGALKALKSAEEMTNKKYSEARSWNVPMDVLSIIQGNYEDEQRHLSYVNQCISDRVWEVAEVKR